MAVVRVWKVTVTLNRVLKFRNFAISVKGFLFRV